MTQPPSELNQPPQPSQPWSMPPSAPTTQPGPAQPHVASLATSSPERNLLFAGVGSALAAFFGVFGTWINAGFISVTGAQGDGMFVLVLSLVGAGALIGGWFTTGGFRRVAPIVAIGAGALSLIVCLVTVVNIVLAEATFITPSPGLGLILSTLGSIGLVVSAALSLKRKRR